MTPYEVYFGAMVHRGPGGETAAPAKMDPRSLCHAAAGSWPNGLRFGCLRAWGSAGHFVLPGSACDTCVLNLSTQLYCNAFTILVFSPCTHNCIAGTVV